MKKLTMILVFACIPLGPMLWAQNVDAVPGDAARLKWFKDARFGMFVHWGIYAVAEGEWKGKYYNQGGEWILKVAGIPFDEYRALGPRFTASKYEPEAWAKLAHDAGMKYVVITAKHHDGCALYDSAASDWNVVKASAAGRDLIAPLAKAVRAEGLKFGCYYSHAKDWTQAKNFDEYLKGIAVPQVREILTRYKPDVIWWDTPDNMTPERVKPFADLLAELSPNIISNDRLGPGFKGDTMTPEQKIPAMGTGQMFEVCMTINGTWGYKAKDQAWKSVRVLLQNLSDISSKGGNFLLNVGPDAEGVIPKESVDRLLAMGNWMKVNGEAIYGTDANPFPKGLPWGRITRRQNPNGSTTLYLHVWNWPANGRIGLPDLKELPASGKLLGNGAAVSAERGKDQILITLPGTAPDADISVVRLDFPGALTSAVPTPPPGH